MKIGKIEVQKCPRSTFDFVCFITKTVHSELVSNLTMESFTAAFRRLTARLGKLTNDFSDNDFSNKINITYKNNYIKCRCHYDSKERLGKRYIDF